MSRRQRGPDGQIRGPQSALTSYLSSMGISAARIREEALARRASAGTPGTPGTPGSPNPLADGAVPAQPNPTPAVTTQNRKKSRTKSELVDGYRDVVDSARDRKGKKVRKDRGKRDSSPKGKGKGKKRPLSDDEDDDLEFNPFYEKSIPLPGQLENCAECETRFTVTPYTKASDDGGLLCTKCAKLKFTAEKSKRPTATKRDRRLQTQSDRVDRGKIYGAKSLVDYCLRIVVQNVKEISELGEMPTAIVDRISMILSKHRALDSDSLNLLMDGEYEAITVYDAGKLSTADYEKMANLVPHARRLVLRNAGQVKDSALQYWAEKFEKLEHLTLRASNLVTNDGWIAFFDAVGSNLLSLDLQWCDQFFDGSCINAMVRNCTELRNLCLKWLTKLEDKDITKLSKLNNQLESLTLQFRQSIDGSALVKLVGSVGSDLKRLVLKEIDAADDELLHTIHKTCSKLQVLKLTGNDSFTTQALTDLFTGWSNGPLSHISFSQDRDLAQEDLSHNPTVPTAADENGDPLDDAPTPDSMPSDPGTPGRPSSAAQKLEPAGVRDDAFRAMMKHSAPRLEKLKLASCRHITSQTCWDVFDARNGAHYPELREVDFSFVDGLDNEVIGLMMRSCPKLERILVFGCFKISSGVTSMMRERRDVALIGCFALETGAQDVYQL